MRQLSLLLLLLVTATSHARPTTEGQALEAMLEAQGYGDAARGWKGEADLVYTITVFELMDVESRYYGNYDTLHFWCTPQEWADLQSSYLASLNYLSSGNVFYADGKSPLDDGDTIFKVAEDHLAKKEYDVVVDVCLGMNGTCDDFYTQAAAKYEKAYDEYDVAWVEAIKARTIINKYIPPPSPNPKLP